VFVLQATLLTQYRKLISHAADDIQAKYPGSKAAAAAFIATIGVDIPDFYNSGRRQKIGHHRISPSRDGVADGHRSRKICFAVEQFQAAYEEAAPLLKAHWMKSPRTRRYFGSIPT